MMEMEQRTDEWFEARLGKVTASRVADVMAKTKTGYGASRGSYMNELLVERLSRRRAERFQNAAMLWGTETEPLARDTYSFLHNVSVAETGFVPHPVITDFGASPDGLIGEDGLVEIKCPNTETHLETMLTEKIPGKYVTQMQAQMACTGRLWCDFVSFDPRLPGDMQMWVSRVQRDDAMIAEMEREIVAFLGELESKVESLRARYSEKAA